MERTYIMLKPDCVERGLVGEIISRIERKSFKIANIKMLHLDEAILREHYAHIVDIPVFPQIIEFMTSGPCIGMIVEGEGAIAGMRKLMGPTKYEDSLPGTIRGDFATSTQHNLIHGSDSPENAEIEIRRFFGPDA